jgi:5-methylcytosine-specific restriction endonuclease McrA
MLLRQEGCCADCGARLHLDRVVFDHRPPLALREPEDDPSYPDRIAAICLRCDRLKTARDLTEITKTKRLATEEATHRACMAEKVCGRPRLSRRAERELARWLGAPKAQAKSSVEDPA